MGDRLIVLIKAESNSQCPEMNAGLRYDYSLYGLQGSCSLCKWSPRWDLTKTFLLCEKIEECCSLETSFMFPQGMLLYPLNSLIFLVSWCFRRKPQNRELLSGLFQYASSVISCGKTGLYICFSLLKHIDFMNFCLSSPPWVLQQKNTEIFTQDKVVLDIKDDTSFLKRAYYIIS